MQGETKQAHFANSDSDSESLKKSVPWDIQVSYKEQNQTRWQTMTVSTLFALIKEKDEFICK